MELNALETSEIRRNVVFGAEGTPYLDGANISRIDYGLHRILGVYPVDVTNAVKYDDPKAWDLVKRHGYIRA